MKPRDFENYLNNIEFDDKPSDAHRDQLEKRLLTHLSGQSEHKKNVIWLNSKLFKFATAACILIIVLIGMKVVVNTTDKDVNVKLEEVRQMASIGDVKGLVAMISNGVFRNKLVSANFLANIGQTPTIETLPMHARGDLILDTFEGNLRLRSTKGYEWLEVVGGRLKIHSDENVSQTLQVRLTHDMDSDSEDWENKQSEFAEFRLQLTDLERELADISERTPEDVNELKGSLTEYKDVLDLIDGAVYISIENDLLKLYIPSYDRTAYVSLQDGLVHTQWHGHILEANSITLYHRLPPVRTDGPPEPTPGWRERFDEVYSLDEGEIIRWIHTPYIPQRQIYATQELKYYQSTNNPPPPSYLSFFWDNGDLTNQTLAMSELTLSTVLMDMGLQRYQYRDETPDNLLSLQVSGDWIIRTGASIEDKLIAFEKVIRNELDRTVKFEKRTVDSDAIIISGQYEHIPLDGVQQPGSIYIYPDSWREWSGPEPEDGGGTGSIEDMIKSIGSFFERSVVFETENLSDIIINYITSFTYSLATANAESDEEMQAILDSVLKNLAKQTSLNFEYGKCEQDIWFIIEQDNTD